MPSKLEHALKLALDGFYVFPLEVNGKLPIGPWREQSTRNPDTIKAWFTCPVMGWEQDYNIGVDCTKSGFFGVDVDTKKGKLGRETYEALGKEFGWPETFTVKTPSGGLHLYYQGAGFRNTQADKGGPLAPGIDTRCNGGYLVAPGSAIDGLEYAIVREASVAPMPEWLKPKMEPWRIDPLKPKSTHKVLSSDRQDDIESAIAFLQSREPATQGHAGDHHTYVTFCMLKERGVSLETAIALVDEYWNPDCCPPWDMDELEKKAQSAYKTSQNATGSKSPHAEFEIPHDIKKENLQIPGHFSHGYLLPDAGSFPKRDWVFGKIALAKNVTLIIAPPGVGKSTLTLAMALSKASGRNIVGIDPLDKGSVAIFNNEDTVEEQSRRLVAAAQYYKIHNDDLSGPSGSRLYLNGRDNAPLKIAKRMTDGTIRADQAGPLVAYLLAHGIRMLIVDPLAMTHPASENSNEEMLVIGNLYAEVANRANCAVILVHHTRKLSTSDSEGHSGNLDSARGASSLGGLARVAYTLNVMSRPDAKLYGVEPKDKIKFLLFEQAKANMSAPGEHRLFFERYGEIIGRSNESDGESVGVLRPAHFTEQRADNGNALLIKEIEHYAQQGETTVPYIVNALIASHGLYMDKQPGALSKSIRRLFDEDTGLTAFRGTLYLEQPMQGRKKMAKIIRWEPFENSLDQLI